MSTDPSKMTSHNDPDQPSGGLRPGLTLAATPIGNARDVTLRLLDALAQADPLICEDTRTTRRLMEIHGIPLNGRRMISYHDHNADAARPAALEALAAGARALYVSDAGTPLVADPGYKLARAAADQGFDVWALPGPSAVLAALCVSSLPSDRFLFAGFPPPKSAARKRFFAEFADLKATLAFYESPRRLADSLADMAAAYGPRPACVARELTKFFEEARRESLTDLAAAYGDPDASPVKGEIVVLIGPPDDQIATDAAIDAALRVALRSDRVKDAAAAVAEALGAPRKRVYGRALALKDAGPDDDPNP